MFTVNGVKGRFVIIDGVSVFQPPAKDNLEEARRAIDKSLNKPKRKKRASVTRRIIKGPTWGGAGSSRRINKEQA
jgi:hypothetical protein